MTEEFFASLKWFRGRKRRRRATGKMDTLRRSRFLVSRQARSSQKLERGRRKGRYNSGNLIVRRESELENSE